MKQGWRLALPMRALAVWSLCGLMLLLPGCVDGATSEVALSVQGARLEEGDCTFGPRGNASDPEWCHRVVVRVENRHTEQVADLSATSWSAQDKAFGSHTQPVVEGETRLDPAGETTVVLGFAAGPETRLDQLHYEGTFGGIATARIPAYS